MEINIESLVIEVTRRCNISCLHCLRGEQEKINMQLKYVDALFSQINYIGILTFTGGEPQLAPETIDKILISAKKHSVDVGNFYCATNGLVNSKKFLYSMVDWYEFCLENDMSAVDLSNDYYHVEQGRVEKDELRLRALKFFHEKHGKTEYNHNDHWILEGRAAEMGLKGHTLKPDKICVYNYDENTLRIENTLYLNCRGKLINGCDWSYESQRKRKDIQIGSVIDPAFSLEDWANKLKVIDEE